MATAGSNPNFDSPGDIVNWGDAPDGDPFWHDHQYKFNSQAELDDAIEQYYGYHPDNMPRLATYNSFIGKAEKQGDRALLQQMSGKSAIQEFFDAVPQSQTFLQAYFPFLQETMLRPPVDMPPEFLRLLAPEGEAELLSRFQDRFREGYGLTPPPEAASAAYAGRFDALLPQLRASQEEQRIKPAEERLRKMGVSGSPALEFLDDLGADLTRGEVALRSDVDVAKGEALRQEWMDRSGFEQTEIGLEQQTAGTLWDIFGRQEERARRNLELGQSDILRRANQPYQAVQLGAPMAGQTFGAASGLFGQGAQRQGDMRSSMWEFEKMFPFLEEASQPIDVPSSSCCVIASISSGSPNSPLVQVFRRYRDTLMSSTAQRGYYIMAEVFVPLMGRWKRFEKLVTWWVDCGRDYLEWKTGLKEARPRAISTAVSHFFFGVFNVLGHTRTAFTRKTGETVRESIKRHTKQLKWKTYRAFPELMEEYNGGNV